MKLASYIYDSHKSFGVVTEKGIVDLKKRLDNKYEDLKTYLANYEEEQLEQIDVNQIDYPLKEISFLPVIPNPSKIMCVGLNYHEHVEEVGREQTEVPIIFLRVADSQVGHRENLVLPKESNMFDFEGEIALIIGKKGRRIKKEEAFDYIAGYACYNDGSIRDWQLRTDQWGPGKNFDRTGAFGPWMVTKEEMEDRETLSLETRVNGQVMQRATTDMLIYSFDELIAFISTFTTLNPGDVIVTGTPGGVGLKREPQVFLKDGDVVEVEVSNIGTLVNKVISE